MGGIVSSYGRKRKPNVTVESLVEASEKLVSDVERRKQEEKSGRSASQTNNHFAESGHFSSSMNSASGRARKNGPPSVGLVGAEGEAPTRASSVPTSPSVSEKEFNRACIVEQRKRDRRAHKAASLPPLSSLMAEAAKPRYLRAMSTKVPPTPRANSAGYLLENSPHGAMDTRQTLSTGSVRSLNSGGSRSEQVSPSGRTEGPSSKPTLIESIIRDKRDKSAPRRRRSHSVDGNHSPSVHFKFDDQNKKQDANDENKEPANSTAWGGVGSTSLPAENGLQD